MRRGRFSSFNLFPSDLPHAVPSLTGDETDPSPATFGSFRSSRLSHSRLRRQCGSRSMP